LKDLKELIPDSVEQPTLQSSQLPLRLLSLNQQSPPEEEQIPEVSARDADSGVNDPVRDIILQYMTITLQS